MYNMQMYLCMYISFQKTQSFLLFWTSNNQIQSVWSNCFNKYKIYAITSHFNFLCFFFKKVRSINLNQLQKNWNLSVTGVWSVEIVTHLNTLDLDFTVICIPMKVPHYEKNASLNYLFCVSVKNESQICLLSSNFYDLLYLSKFHLLRTNPTVRSSLMLCNIQDLKFLQ